MAITYFAAAAMPADNDATGNAGPTVTITPPGSMATNDYVVVLLSYKSTATNLTFNNTTTGGQSWSSDTKRAGATGMMSQIWRCRYNGTWTANPVWTMSNSGTSPMQGAMLVFRGVDTATPIDVAEASAQYAAPSSPFDVTITGVTTGTSGAVVLALWASNDDNSWTVQTAGWTNPGGQAQWRNLAGTDISLAAAYKEITPAGASGNITNRQTANGGDSGNTHILALRPAAAAAIKRPSLALLGVGR